MTDNASARGVPEHIHDWVTAHRDVVRQWTDDPEYRRRLLADVEAGEYGQYGLSQENVAWIQGRLRALGTDAVATPQAQIGMY
jgi:hypothetical protein